MGRSGPSRPGRRREPGILPMCMVHELIREGARRCVGGRTAEGICCRRGTTSKGLPSTRLYLQVSKRAEPEQSGGWKPQDLQWSNRCTNTRGRSELGYLAWIRADQHSLVHTKARVGGLPGKARSQYTLLRAGTGDR